MGASEIIATTNIIATIILAVWTVHLTRATNKMDRRLELDNQVKFSLQQTQLKVLNDVYDKFLDWAHLLFVVDIPTEKELNAKQRDIVYETYSEFNKASFRVELWFPQKKALHAIIDQLLDAGFESRDYIVSKLDEAWNIDKSKITPTYLENIVNHVKSINKDVDDQTDELKRLIKEVMDEMSHN